MNINDIKPSIHGISDKYSWNLYVYLKKNKGKHRILWDKSDGKPLHPMNIYVLQGTIGRNLLSILWRSYGDRYCFSSYPLDSYMDITVSFWESYEANGRCVFHGHNEAWLVGGDQRFQSINKNSKRCLWCGAVLRRTVKTTKVIRRIEHWEPVHNQGIPMSCGVPMKNNEIKEVQY